MTLPVTIQGQYEYIAKRLCEVVKERQQLQEAREEATRPLKEQLKQQLEATSEGVLSLMLIESELRTKMAALYQQAKEAREQAYAEALAAQEAGDLAGVAQASLRELENLIHPNSNVFFRSKSQFELTNLAEVPTEYLTVDWAKIEAANIDVPGVRKIELPIVVVKTGE